MNLLSNVLRVNGLFSTLAGLAAIVFAGPLSESMNVAEPILYVVGVGTLGFGLAILFADRRHEVNLRFASAVALADVLWVVAAIVVLAIPGSMDQKWILAAVSVAVAVFAALQFRGLGAATVEKPLELATSIDIEATPDAVWANLVDFRSYSDWNPFITEAEGEAVKGSQLEARLNGTKFKPIVTVADTGNELEWLGNLIVPGVFDGRHRFQLIPNAGGTTLIQSEQFTGALAPAIMSMIDEKTESGFEAMNASLKARSEGS